MDIHATILLSDLVHDPFHPLQNHDILHDIIIFIIHYFIQGQTFMVINAIYALFIPLRKACKIQLTQLLPVLLLSLPCIKC